MKVWILTREGSNSASAVYETRERAERDLKVNEYIQDRFDPVVWRRPGDEAAVFLYQVNVIT